MVLQGHSRVGAAPQDSPDFHEAQARARQFARNAIVSETPVRRLTLAIDSVVLPPIAGTIILAALLFVMFPAVFAWSEAPIGMIACWFTAVGTFVTQLVQDGLGERRGVG